MRPSAVLFAVVLTVSVAGAPKHDWVTGIVTEISRDYEQTGWNTSPDGASSTRKGFRYTDYNVQVGQRLYTLRLNATAASRILAWGAGWAVDASSPNVGAGVGEPVNVAIEGSQAWILVGRKEYRCSVVRQVLLSVPAPKGSSEAFKSEGERKADADVRERPTLQREK